MRNKLLITCGLIVIIVAVVCVGVIYNFNDTNTTNSSNITNNQTQNNTNSSLNSTNNTTNSNQETSSKNLKSSTKTKSDPDKKYRYSEQYGTYITEYTDSNGVQHIDSKDGSYKGSYDPVTGGFEEYSKEYGYESNGRPIRSAV